MSLEASGSRRSDAAGLRLRIDYQVARRQIDAVVGYPPAVRSRAFAVYVGLFELSDASGSCSASTLRISDVLSVPRATWTLYRGLLETAGLLEVGEWRGGQVRPMQLLGPTID